jgi:hypothetical protein
MAKIVVGSPSLTQPLLLYLDLGPAMLGNIGYVRHFVITTGFSFTAEAISLKTAGVSLKRGLLSFRGCQTSFTTLDASFILISISSATGT